MKRYVFFLLVCLYILFSCKNKKDTIAPKQVYRQSPVDSAYQSLRPRIQQFQVDNTKPATIKAAGGTKVFIPANSFENINGKPVENVQLEVVEAFTLQEFIYAGLTTVSNGQLLMSAGMVFINAKADGKDLRLKEGISLTVAMPSMGNNNGYQLFTGNGTNWQVDSSMLQQDYAFTLPLDLLYPEGNKQYWICIENWDEKNERVYYMDTSIVTVTDKRYENSVIATREFRWRADILRQMTTWMGYLTHQAHYLAPEECHEDVYDYTLWREYYNHPHRSLRETDSIVKKLYTDYFKTHQKELAAFCDKVNKYKRSYYYNWTDTNYYFDFRIKSLEQSYMDILSIFPPKETKEIRLIDTHGVNPEAPDAAAQLAAKGIAMQEINQILDYTFRRNAIISELQQYKTALLEKEKTEKIYQTTVFSLDKLGWINCDRFYDDPDAGKAEIFVTDNSSYNFDYIDCSLVIPAVNARLSAFPKSKGSWAFTKNEGPYTRLPIGRPAVVTGVAIRNDSVFFASRKITISNVLNVQLSMQYIPTQALNDSLKSVLQP